MSMNHVANLRGQTGPPGITEAQAQAMIGMPEWVDLPVDTNYVDFDDFGFLRIAKIAGIVHLWGEFRLLVTERPPGQNILLMESSSIPAEYRAFTSMEPTGFLQVGVMATLSASIIVSQAPIFYQRAAHRIVGLPSSGLGDPGVRVRLTATWYT